MHRLIWSPFAFPICKCRPPPLENPLSQLNAPTPARLPNFFLFPTPIAIKKNHRDEKFYWTYQRSVSWPYDYIGPDSMTRWSFKKSDGFTDVGLYKISESIRAYAYLILSSQASARSGIVDNAASALTAQSAFLNNLENVVNRRVDIREYIIHYQDTLSYASSKVDYSMGQNIYTLPSNMNLKSGRELSGTTTKFSFPMKNLVWGKMMRLMKHQK